MSKSLLRILFLIPVIAGLLAATSFFGNHSLPQPAEEYLRWYMNQPLEGAELILNRMALIGLVGMVASTIGLIMFWSPARYIYLVSLLLALSDQAVTLPVLISGWENFLDNVAQISIGLNLGLLFSMPGRTYFEPK